MPGFFQDSECSDLPSHLAGEKRAQPAAELRWTSSGVLAACRLPFHRSEERSDEETLKPES